VRLELLTERLALAPLSTDDLELCLEMFTNPDVVKYAGGTVSVAEIENDLPKWTRRGGDGCIGIWCISDRRSGEKVGSFALLPIPIEEEDTDFSLVVPGKIPDGDIEIGYFLKPSAWHQGIATEVCKRMLQFVFEDSPLNEVVATFDKENTPSRHVLLKAGFSDHGMRRCYGEDGPDFRITRDEWTALQMAS
jgi:ribosomal-protein-alanine N-acetyltransferase